MADKIKVLIVDDNETTRDGTRRLLEYEDAVEIVGYAEDGVEAIERVKELNPDVVLMDINMPRMTGIEATQRLQVEAPRTQVIVVSVQDDAHYLKEAFRAGAVDFVAKPVTGTELSQAIQRAYDKIPAEAPPVSQQEMMYQQMQQMGGMPGMFPMGGKRDGAVITVVGLKGGVGKTTVAVNVAVGLAHAGKSVVLVDGNVLFGDVSVFLNTRSQYSVVDLAREAAASPEAIDPEYIQQVVVAHESGVNLLVAPANPAESEPVSQQAMTALLDNLKKHYDFVVVDTSTTFDETLVASIKSADRLLVVTAPTMPALKNTRLLFNELKALEFPMESVVVVLNWVDRTTRITTDQINNFLRQTVSVEIPSDPLGTEAVNQGVPLVTGDAKRSPAVRPLTGLAQMIREAIEAQYQQVGQPQQQPQEQPRRRGLFGG